MTLQVQRAVHVKSNNSFNNRTGKTPGLKLEYSFWDPCAHRVHGPRINVYPPQKGHHPNLKWLHHRLHDSTELLELMRPHESTEHPAMQGG